jgi:2-oxoglutarate ferredoxin oxidoreductase subunit alpha
MKSINVVIAGAAGEGVQTVGDILAHAVSAQGYSVFTWQEYESRIRGGRNSYSIRIEEEPMNAPLFPADVLLALNEEAAEKYESLLKEDGILIADKQIKGRMIAVPFTEIAKKEFKNHIYSNTIAIGLLAGTIGLDLGALKKTMVQKFAEKDGESEQINERAAEMGYDLATGKHGYMCMGKLQPRDERYYLVSGNETIPLAAAYAGCRFIAAYPMTPSTGIITFLAKEEDTLGIFTEQAEDEIAAVNMAIGASYAGTRAMTATSGGGFALMTEGVSLAGMTETPLVIVLAQRPGPATGLPTRTAQGELLFAVNAGHGEFPRMVLAPSDPHDAFRKVVKAFDMADRYQMPVIVLTDHFLMDSHFSLPGFEFDDTMFRSYLADPEEIEDYRRYLLTENGISPRLYPGQSEHLVCADSDEHDETGHITEDIGRTAMEMVEKRLEKFDDLKKEISLPEEIGLKDADVVFVGWGSSKGAIFEGINILQEKGHKAGMIHFTELWPLPEYTFPKGKIFMTVENNSTGQLARLLRSEYNVKFSGSITRYDGLPLTGEYIRSRFDEYNRRL